MYNKESTAGHLTKAWLAELCNSKKIKVLKRPLLIQTVGKISVYINKQKIIK